jgi:hypothetical protein
VVSKEIGVVQMYKKNWMRAYQAFLHVIPD